MEKRVLEQLNQCTGCGACFASCPCGAVSVREDPEQRYGYTAWIDTEKCVECGRCLQICPAASEKTNSNTDSPQCYAVYAEEEILRKSASGGAFSMLADAVLARDGIVIGAAYNEDFRVVHIAVEKRADLDRIRRSKYVQSNVLDAYRIINDTPEEREILFVGTPCQVAGIRSVFSDRHKLYCVDLYCGHTPSFHLFRQYLEEKADPESILSYDFRTKGEGWKCEIAEIKLKDGSRILCHTEDDDYQLCYHTRLMMREVCEHCRFAGRPRQGDLSIADYWWIEESYPELKNDMGTSAVLVNNEKGEYLLKDIQSTAELCRKTELESMKKNRPEGVEAHPARDRFYRLLAEGQSFSKSAQSAFHRRYDIVLWGNWSEKNYGSELTYYALFQVLRAEGKEVLMIERPREAVWGPNDSPVLFRDNPYPAGSCYVPETRRNMYELKECSDTFMVGSDQIWHHDLYDCFGKVCFLEFVHGPVKKIAYAASFGRDYWTGDAADTVRTSKQMQYFDHVSVREGSGVDLCRDLFQVEAQRVLDPVFLCPRDLYQNLADKTRLPYEKHIAVYALDESRNKEIAIRVLEEKLGLKAWIISDAFIKNVEEGWKREIILDASLEDWLYSIITSDYVLTDSFHGMCIAILFNRPFIAISNPGRGENRFRELLEILNLSERLIGPDSDPLEVERILNEPVCFDEANEILNREKDLSLEWLKKALESRNKSPNLTESLLEERLDEEIRLRDEEIHDLQVIRDWHTGRLDYHDKIENWHTERLDYHDKIENWHTGRLEDHDKQIKELEKQVRALKEMLEEKSSGRRPFKGLNRKSKGITGGHHE